MLATFSDVYIYIYIYIYIYKNISIQIKIFTCREVAANALSLVFPSSSSASEGVAIPSVIRITQGLKSCLNFVVARPISYNKYYIIFGLEKNIIVVL